MTSPRSKPKNLNIAACSPPGRHSRSILSVISQIPDLDSQMSALLAHHTNEGSQFGTLAALHPWRVELGLGRAAGSDQITAPAIRRTLYGSGEEFPQDVVELMGYFQPAEPGQAVQAVGYTAL